MPATLEGTVISNGQGQFKILKGGQWADYKGPPPSTGQRGLTGSNATLSPDDQKFLNSLSQDAQKANELVRYYTPAEKAIRRLKTGPYWGRLMSAATPEDKGGILDTIGGVVVGGPARLTGAITKENSDDYQTLRSMQQQFILDEQTRQKGVQTEGDAARIALAGISPLKSVDVNMGLIGQSRARAQRAQAKAVFYNNFAQQHGLHGTDEHGRTADELWTTHADDLAKRMFPPKQAPAATIKVLSKERLP